MTQSFETRVCTELKVGHGLVCDSLGSAARRHGEDSGVTNLVRLNRVTYF